MAEGNSPGGKRKFRLVLGDVTNRIGKRGISEREKNKVKCFDFNDKDKVKSMRVSPRPCPEINSMKGNVISGLSKVSNENRDPNVSGFESGYGVSKSSTDVYDGVQGNSRIHGGNDDIKKFNLEGANVVSQDANKLAGVDDDLGGSCNQTEYSKGDPNLADKEGGKALNENKCPDLEHSVGKNVVDLTIISGGEIVSSESHDKENGPNFLDFHRSDANQSIDTEVNDELGDNYSADTSKTVSETGNDDGKNCDTGEVDMNSGGTHNDTNFHHNAFDDHNADNFVLSQSGSVDCMLLPQSQESRVFGFGIDGSTKSKEDECTNMTEGTNSIGACSCSFCTKAAYIWLDLHHKDIKARISALKKGQKDASILAEKSSRIKADEKHGAQSVPRVSPLESNLMHQWRSLFKYMSNTWEDEGNQLEANLLQLNNLREKCKADLERINTEQSEKH